MKVKFYLNNKIGKNGKNSILCFIRGQELIKQISFNTGYQIYQNEWNPNKEEVRKSCAEAEGINIFLDSTKSKIKNEFNNFIDKNGKDAIGLFNHLKGFVKFNANDLVEINQVVNFEDEFLNEFDNFINLKSSQVSKGTVKRYYVIKNILIEFTKKKKIELKFSSIDLKFTDALIQYLINHRKLTNNTAKKYLNVFKVFLNWAFDRNLIDNIEYKKASINGFTPDIFTLNEKELEILYNLDLSEKSHLDKTRDIFCFECFTGQRISDIKNFNIEDVKDGVWKLRTTKSKDIINVPLVDKAIAIINKYSSQNQLFPIISEQKLNLYLKEIGQIAGFDELMVRSRYQGAKRIDEKLPKYKFMTTHMARKTFVTICVNNDVSDNVLRSITGHKDPRTLKRYYEVSDKKKEETLKRVFK